MKKTGLGCLFALLLGIGLLYSLSINEPPLFIGSRTRPVAERDHHLRLPNDVQILSREAGGNFMDGHITTVLLVPTSSVSAILAQVQPSSRFGNKVVREGTETNGKVFGKQEGADELRITTASDLPGFVHMTITTLHD